MPGLVDGHLAPPPSSPNAVSSQADPSDTQHHIAPLPLGDPATWKARLKAVVDGMDRTAWVADDGPYLHATFTTWILRYVDDVEFLADPEAGVIHVRSASRVGYSDLGVNRSRVEAIRWALEHPNG